MWQSYLPHSTGQEITAINFILQVLIIIYTNVHFSSIDVIAYLMHICFVLLPRDILLFLKCI